MPESALSGPDTALNSRNLPSYLYSNPGQKAMHAKRIVSSLYLYPGQTLAGTLECTLLMGQWKWGQITISCCLMDSSVIKREAMSDRGSGGGLCGSATRQGIPGRRLIETMVRVGVVLSVQLPPKQIGSIDLHMPEKTHAEISQFCLQTSTS
jgi:hypothetical protein